VLKIDARQTNPLGIFPVSRNTPDNLPKGLPLDKEKHLQIGHHVVLQLLMFGCKSTFFAEYIKIPHGRHFVVFWKFVMCCMSVTLGKAFA
jgi:hypothetical protein